MACPAEGVAQIRCLVLMLDFGGGATPQVELRRNTSLSADPGRYCVFEFSPFRRGHNRAHDGVLRRFPSRTRTHARVSAVVRTEKRPECERERDSASAIALKRARARDFGPESVKIRFFGVREALRRRSFFGVEKGNKN